MSTEPTTPHNTESAAAAEERYNLKPGTLTSPLFSRRLKMTQAIEDAIRARLFSRLTVQVAVKISVQCEYDYASRQFLAMAKPAEISDPAHAWVCTDALPETASESEIPSLADRITERIYNNAWRQLNESQEEWERRMGLRQDEES